MLTLGVGVGVLITSLILTYVISSKADMLFSAGREPANATYWSTRRLHRPTTTTTTTTITTTTTTSIPTRHGQALFSLNHTSRYRLDTAAEGGVFFFLWWRLHVYGTHWGEAWHEDWTGLDWPGWIWTHQGQKTLVRHQQALPVERCLYSFLFSLFFLIVKKKKKKNVFVYCVMG